MPSVLVCEVELEKAVDKVFLSILDAVFEVRDLGFLFLLFGLNLVSCGVKSIDFLLELEVSRSFLSIFELSFHSCFSLLLEFIFDHVQLSPWIFR